ncbi:MAG: GNAT family N-acetyltransferase [Spirochaetales bacterium]|nr:GNAT family N-acetyltransferase [Spirochaetales bacterium]
MNLKIELADLSRQQDADALLEMLYSFSLEIADEDHTAIRPEPSLIENLQDQGISRIYFLKTEEETIGIAVCFRGFSTFRNRPLLNLHDFFIRQEYRKKGYGRRFLQFIEKDAKEQGFCRITLEVYAHNTKAQRVYNRCGFTGNSGDGKMFFMSREL